MITVREWTRAVVLGGAVIVTLAVASPRPLATVSLDLLGDGLPGVTVSSPTGALAALGIVAQRRGTFRVEVIAVDVDGCRDRTGAAREVDVR